MNDSVSFRARFGGVPFDVWVPTSSILGIYARETGQGMIFSNDSGTSDSMQDHDDVDEAPSRPHLRVVK
jgi:stringent starvation protein B